MLPFQPRLSRRVGAHCTTAHRSARQLWIHSDRVSRFYQIMKLSSEDFWRGHRIATDPLNHKPGSSEREAADAFLEYLRANPKWCAHTFFTPKP